MPVRDGGLGLPAVAHSVAAAFVGSWATALPAVLDTVVVLAPETFANSGNASCLRRLRQSSRSLVRSLGRVHAEVDASSHACIK